ncbi:MAG: copper-translocating P-type ATPase [Candidatus Marinimicrobia bacterium]|jgi:Cu+-exporting ATPase|nr:copper-translocating P-type ATPase [Candidatus Neomarinimicrobiota bacterium]MBT3632540.1 copper-translocating P-type ATPase [Candidatus Neomarinimicrobiota bacterium]MBT3824939.1 copper-translocating P-type ATPase [Candidatus Neomarinimicrobiota bacterium]MBT4132808.1 copper-translocating P-type ATPase [Candidatus Neomarinimicrobiota bacterium]MBT4295270.1 copper-translocating P-type ATPase [Candidatus Neomarinimicrobiota bacterium]
MKKNMSEYQVKNPTAQHQYQFDVEGMSCAACVANVETAIKQLPGVQEVSVNLATESATVTSLESIPIKKFTRVVSKMGYKLEPQGSSSLVHRQQRAIASWKRLLVIQAIFGIPLLVYAMLEMILELDLLSTSNNILVQLTLATILIISGFGYYQRGFKHLIMLVPNMDTLVALGTGSAYIYSLISALNLQFGWEVDGFQTLYFEAAGTILLFITFGKWLESVARGKTTEALTGLMEQMPTEAEVKRDGAWATLPMSDVKSGDEIRVKPHSKIPVDGVVIEGASNVDESSISGESLPVEKLRGSKVIGASLNLQTTLILRAEKIGRDSMFGQIIDLVEKAQMRKPKIQKLVDKIAAIFVPVVLSLAILSGITWFALGFGLTFAINVMISVLIIACPCALGLATPTALVVGSGIAARGGILFKSADAFQLLSKVDIMVFDKTGTITESKSQLIEKFPQDDLSYLGIAMGLEQFSQHPLAETLIDYGNHHSIKPADMSDVREVAGFGLEGHKDGSVYRIRKIDQADALPEDFTKTLRGYYEKGYIVSGVFSETSIMGLMAFSDTIKTESSAVVNALTKKGIQSFLLTGDKEQAAKHVAHETGIQNFRSEVLPADKHDHINTLKAGGKTVGMLGDGINDAPALVAADIGLSFGGGTDIAVNAADVIFLNNSLSNLVFGHRIAQATISKIHQNLFWAFIYNLAGIPIAMGLLYPFTGTLLNPMFAGMAMAFSSVSVVTNTLLLRSKKYFQEI